MQSMPGARWAGLALATALAVAGCQGSGSPSASPSAEPTPTPAPPTDEQVVLRFLALVGNPALTMHVVADGKVTVTGSGTTNTVKIASDMDISGPDGVGKAVVDTGPSDVTFKMLLVGGQAYIDDNGTWTEIPDYHPSTPLNPFAGLAGPADVSYRGRQVQDGERIHHLSALVWPGGDLSQLEAQGWTAVKIDYNLTTMTVDDSGAPIEMSFTGGISGRFNDVAASAAIEVTYDFSEIGEPVEIPSPA
jgi:hypothetical protein